MCINMYNSYNAVSVSSFSVYTPNIFLYELEYANKTMNKDRVTEVLRKLQQIIENVLKKWLDKQNFRK